MHERAADSIQHAQSLSRTRYFWIVNYLCDYADWDWLWEPPPWQCHQRHAWASQWQKDSGTYLIPKTGFQDTNYHDAPVLARQPDRDLWCVPEGLADTFDFSWHPDPADPPMTYQFGTQWQKTGGPIYFNGGSVTKYVTDPRAHRSLVDDNWQVPAGIDVDSFDFRPESNTLIRSNTCKLLLVGITVVAVFPSKTVFLKDDKEVRNIDKRLSRSFEFVSIA